MSTSLSIHAYCHFSENESRSETNYSINCYFCHFKKSFWNRLLINGLIRIGSHELWNCHIIYFTKYIFHHFHSTRKCKPHCRAGCEPHGTCKAPDVCSCHFGYVGQNCTTECLCNKHSECDSIEEKHICKSCQNNTQVNFDAIKT